MKNRMFWIPVFIVGMAVGALITFFLAPLRAAKRPHALWLKARARILNQVKEQREKDIRREMFRTTEAVSSEIARSLRLLLNSTRKLLLDVREDRDSERRTNLS